MSGIEEPFRMVQADQITDADRAKLMDLFGLDASPDGEIQGLTTHPDFALLVIMHTTGHMTARIKVCPHQAASMLRGVADVIELEGIFGDHE